MCVLCSRQHTLETGLFIMCGVRVTSAGDWLDLYMEDLELDIRCFQLNVSPGSDGRLYHVEVWTCMLNLVVRPPELREDLLAPHQEEQRGQEAQADVEDGEVRQEQQEKQLLVGQQGVDVSFEGEKEDHHSLVEEDNCSQVLCLVHCQKISLVFPELLSLLGLPCSPLDGESELDDVELDHTEEGQAHQRRLQSPSRALVVLACTETSNGDVSEELRVGDQVAEDVSERDGAADDQLQPEENVEILQVGSGLREGFKIHKISVLFRKH